MIGIFGAILTVQKNASWEPKTKLLPPVFVKTAQFLLNHGMADPRGCELRNAQYSFYVPAETISLRGHQIGWVKPGQDSKNPTVITPYGIAVKAGSIGSQSLYGRLLPRNPRGGNDQFSDFYPLGDDSVLSLFLMAIHGEEELVATYLNNLSNTNKIVSDLIPHQALVGYKFALTYGAMNAYANGDDALAATYFDRAIGDLSEFEEFKKDLEPLSTRHSQPFSFGFMQETLGVRRAIKERQNKGPKKILSLSQIAKRPLGEQVTILIDQMSETGNPKYPELTNWQYSANTAKGHLLEIGHAAIPKLLAALESDDRMTRAQPMARSGPSKQLPHFVPVKSVIHDILKTMAFFNGGEISDENLRKYWKKNLGKSEFQQIYDTLLDDSASSQWKYAALALLQSDSKLSPSIRFHIGTSIEPQEITVRPEMRDQVLKAYPPISDLLFRRLASSARMNYTFGLDSYGFDDLLTLALISYYIDPDHSLQALRMTSTKFLSSLQPKVTQDFAFSTSHFAPVIEARKILGDPSYISDLEAYAAYLRISSPIYTLEPAKYFIDRLEEPAVAKLTKSVFFDAESEYSVQRLAKSNPIFVGVIASELLNLSEGRAGAMALLDDTSVVDPKIVEASSNRRLVFVDDGRSMRDEPVQSYGEIRVCDLVASSLKRVKGCPPFSLEWPIERRDLSIIELKKFVGGLGLQQIVFKDRLWLNRVWL